MKLKKIEIFGFKSFADKTILNFHDGITGIVGPNGCGKSNISDAFRWVFGEQSAKSMRGEKMFDVIFAGTSTRKPLNYAEVTITFSDVEEYLPVDYEEIAVTRRIYRSGESEYLVNRQTVRLKDIQDIFLDSGVGKDSFSIFEQGKIDQVINLSPQDRRYIFEEAAGISRFLQRKREALRKLGSTDQNLERVRDIHREVEKQIRVLERQAEKARIFKDDKIKLETLEKSLFVSKWDGLEKKFTDVFEELTVCQAKVDDANKKLECLLEGLKCSKEDLAYAQDDLGKRKEALFQAKSEKEIQIKQKHTLKERLQESIEKEGQWKGQLDEMRQKREQRCEEKREIEQNLMQVQRELEHLQGGRREQTERVKSLENQASELRQKMQEIQKRLIESMQKETQAESEIRQNSLRMEAFLERKQEHGERLEKLNEEIRVLSDEIHQKANKQEHEKNEKDRQDKALDALLQDLQVLKVEIDEKFKEKQAKTEITAEQKARLNVLLRLKNEMEGFSLGTKRLLKETADQKSVLFGKVTGLYEHITPEKGEENAFSVVMKPYAQTLVTENQDDFDAVVAFTTEKQIREFSLICLEHISNSDAGDARDDSFLKSAHVHPLTRHFLKDIYIADGLKSAFEKPGAVFCKDVFVDKKKVVFFTRGSEDSVFMREAEIKTLQKKLADDEKELQKLNAITAALDEKREKLQELIKEVEKEKREREMELREIAYSLSRLEKEVENKTNEMTQRKEAIEEFERSERSIQEKTKELEEMFKKAKLEAENMRCASAKADEDLNLLVHMLKKEQSDFDQKESSYLAVLQNSRRLENELHVLQVKDQESRGHENRLLDEVQKGKALQEEIKQKETEFKALLEQIEQTLLEITEKCAEFDDRVQEKKQGIDDLEIEVEDSRRRRREAEDALHKADIQKTQIEAQRQALVEELSEFYNLCIEELKRTSSLLEITFDEAEKEIRTLRRKLEAAGDINMTSIEEHENLKTRYEFLRQQIEDLEKSKEELLGIISQLDLESRKLFKTTFDMIRENFRKNFKILFNGGEADLELTETQDILEAGIEIVAKPPGKQMRSISLLSGGEKCLTATALLFAIFEVKTSPFCILDEIDAPLDDTNVERFLRVVKQFIDKCQFIIITHNKRTMAMADRLFGVSMQEKGVSKLLAMTFSTEASPETSPEPVLV